MSYETTTLLVFGFKVSGAEADLILEKYSDDIHEGVDGCLLYLYGNMVSGNTAYLLGAGDSCHWGPDASSKAEKVNLDGTHKVTWVSQLFEICYQAGVSTNGKIPDWLMVTTYG